MKIQAFAKHVKHMIRVAARTRLLVSARRTGKEGVIRGPPAVEI